MNSFLRKKHLFRLYILVKWKNRCRRVHISSTAWITWIYFKHTAPNIISLQTSPEHVYDKSRKRGDTIRHTEQTFALRAGVHYVPCTKRANHHASKDIWTWLREELLAGVPRKAARRSSNTGVQETWTRNLRGISRSKTFFAAKIFCFAKCHKYFRLSATICWTYDSAEAKGGKKPPGMECNLDYFVHVPAAIPSDEKYLESIAGMSDDDLSISRCGFLISAPFKVH